MQTLGISGENIQESNIVGTISKSTNISTKFVLNTQADQKEGGEESKNDHDRTNNEAADYYLEERAFTVGRRSTGNG